MERWSIQVDKQYFQFSAAHFLIFPDGSAERLHGHNYRVYVEVEAELSGSGLVLDFIRVKPVVKEMVDELDEHWIVPGGHPVLRCTGRDDGTTEIVYLDRRYLVPSADVIVLPVNNTSAENLAAWFGRELLRRLRKRFPEVTPRAVQVAVEESPGQRAVYRRETGA